MTCSAASSRLRCRAGRIPPHRRGTRCSTAEVAVRDDFRGARRTGLETVLGVDRLEATGAASGSCRTNPAAVIRVASERA